MDQPALSQNEEPVQILVALIDRRRAELEARARPLGEQIYAETTQDFVDRIATYWSVWKREFDTMSAVT